MDKNYYCNNKRIFQKNEKQKWKEGQIWKMEK